MFELANEYLKSLTTWDDLKPKLNLTQEDWDEINLKNKIISEIIEVRQSQDVTQKSLEELSGVRQPVIARLEGNTSDPRLTTILKILRPLSKTLAIVPLEESAVRVRGND